MAVKIKAKAKFYLRWVSCSKVYTRATPTDLVVATYNRKILLKRRSTVLKQKDSYIKENEVMKKEKEEAHLSFVSCLKRELPKSSIGWPLLQKTNATTTQEDLRISEAKRMSINKWVMSVPNRSETVISHKQIEKGVEKSHIEETNNTQLMKDSEITSEDTSSCSSTSFSVNETLKFSKLSCWPFLQKMSTVLATSEPTKTDSFMNNNENPQIPENMTNNNCPLTSEKLKFLNKVSSSGCRLFCYIELETATCEFSSENLIGKGGFSNVYKGCFPSGELLAIKILKPYKEAWADFSLEVEILSSVKHKNITTLLGVCLENGHLISVYNFFPKGSLEENLHGQKGTCILPWKVRFKVAISVAEALNYLHDECPKLVIHRDIKSSNILFTNDLQPKLSDFGLAMWGCRDSVSGVTGNIVGTFGYMAPEYFMSGIVSDKVDVYAFGVVLLELLSGRRPISDNLSKGQPSLVKWAENLLEKGDLKALIDTKLHGDFDVAQMQRMALVAKLCITQSTRLRPNICQILKLLMEQMDAKELKEYRGFELKASCCEDDKTSQPVCNLQTPDARLMSCSHHTTHLTSAKKIPGRQLKDYLQDQH